MARPRLSMGTRHVTPRFWDNEELADLAHTSAIQPDIRLTMIGLWAASDVLGRFEWRPRILASKIYPTYPEDQLTVEAALELFVVHGYLLKYEVDGKWYGAWPHWGEHNDFRSGKSEYPPPPGELQGITGSQSPHNVNVKMEMENEKEGQSLSLHCDTVAKEKATNLPFISNSNTIPLSDQSSSPVLPPAGRDRFDDIDEEEEADVEKIFSRPNRGPADAAKIAEYGPRRELAELLHEVLPASAQENAPDNWKQLWSDDFGELLDTADQSEIEAVIKILPRLKLSKYIVRAKMFVEKYPQLLAAYKKLTKGNPRNKSQ